MNAAYWSLVAERAIKTVAQTALASIAATGALNALELNWAEIGGVALLAGVLSVLTSVALPSNELKNAKEAHAE